MKKKQVILFISFVLMIMLVLSGCGEGASNIEDNEGVEMGETKELTLSHALSTEHPVHDSMVKFADLVKEKTDGKVEVKIFPNAVLGDERASIEAIQAGTVDIAKVAVGVLENFNDIWSIFAVPYVFEDAQHGRDFCNSEIIEDFYKMTIDSINVRPLTWYDAGCRNFYTRDKAILAPEDLKGLLVRVASSQTQIETAEALGASATPIAFGELYTALQQGVVDAADNGIVAFMDNNLGEVAKEFSFTEHVFSPDYLVMSNKVFEELTPEQQVAVKEAAKESTVFHSESWEGIRQEAIQKAEAIGVTIHYPDLQPFAEALADVRAKYAEDETIGMYMEKISEMR